MALNSSDVIAQNWAPPRMILKPTSLIVIDGRIEYRILDQELQRRGLHPLGLTGAVPEDDRFENYSDPWAVQCWRQYREHYGSLAHSLIG
jgi:hypothetical protein